MTLEKYSEEEIREMGQKEFRKEFPSGWMELTRYETLVLLVDVFLEESPAHALTVEDLHELTGSSEKSISTRIERLVELEVLAEETKGGDPAYTVNEQSPIIQDLYSLNQTVDMVKYGE